MKSVILCVYVAVGGEAVLRAYSWFYVWGALIVGEYGVTSVNFNDLLGPWSSSIYI